MLKREWSKACLSCVVCVYCNCITERTLFLHSKIFGRDVIVILEQWGS